MSCGCGGSATDGGGGCCCGQRTPQTPLPVVNRPGLPRINRRVATQATAKSTMLRALTDPALPATSRFTARTDDDFGVAIVDAAAVVADIVTFYTDRFVNEHYLRTAGERRSLIELSRLIGYQPAPGLAPTTDLAFTMDTSPGAPSASTIPAGTGVQSSPDPGQSPVVYETLADIAASPQYNAIRPRRSVAHPHLLALDPGGIRLAFAGTAAISIGDGVLYLGSSAGEAASLRFGLVSSVAAVDAVPDRPGRPGIPARTEVLVSPISDVGLALSSSDLPDPSVAKPAAVPASVSFLAGKSISAANLDGALLGRSMTVADIAGPFAAAVPTPATAVVFGQQRALFGSQAPRASTLASSVILEMQNSASAPAAAKAWAANLSLPWDSASVASLGGGSGDIDLDGSAPSVAIGSLVVLRDGTRWGAYRITRAASVGVAAQGISGRAWRVGVDPTLGLTSFSIRTTAAFTGGRVLALADVPAPTTVPVGSIELDGLMLGLRAGRPVVMTGEPSDDPGHPITLSTTLAAVVHDFGPAGSTTITLADTPTSPLARASMTIAGNVAPASQGETRGEILGSGDGRQSFQTFTLRQPPLTYLSSAGAAGLTSTLCIWVDGVRWNQVDSFPGSGPGDRVYVVRHMDGRILVQFGDGLAGARLPTGTANVTAVYRSGAALSGQVRAGQLSLPMSRAGGVTAVTNPAASQGGDDPETVDSARVSAPLRVTTLDRIVSMADYALYARAFPGVAKAQAVWARAGTHRGVLLTVAGDSGAILVPDRGIGQHLLAALRSYGDPLVPVALAPYRPRSFRFTATVRVDPARARTDVLAGASRRLVETFCFAARDLGQPVTASEILADIHAVPGVIAATITALWMFDPGSPSAAAPTATATVPGALVAGSPTPGADIGTLIGAELIVLDAAPISWGVLP